MSILKALFNSYFYLNLISFEYIFEKESAKFRNMLSTTLSIFPFFFPFKKKKSFSPEIYAMCSSFAI